VKRPTHFILTVTPRQIPVETSQYHHTGLKAFDGPSSFWLEKHVQARAVKAVAAIKGESKRMRRLLVRRPFSERVS